MNWTAVEDYNSQKAVSPQKTHITYIKNTTQEIQLQSEIQYKDIIIDLNHREIIRDNKKIELTYTEFEILQLLAKNPGSD